MRNQFIEFAEEAGLNLSSSLTKVRGIVFWKFEWIRKGFELKRKENTKTTDFSTYL